jgi:preprotein translocase subunit SecA
MRRFAAERVSKVMQMVGMDEDMPLESGLVSRFIEQAQTRVEGYNFDIRKNVVEYDDVIAKQREVIYADRRAVLERADMHQRVLDMIKDEVSKLVNMHIPGHVVTEEEQLEGLFTVLEVWVQIPDEMLPENIHAVRREDLKKKLVELVINHYEERGRQLDELVEQNPGLGIPTIRDLERSYTLQVIDRLWMDHIDALDVMRASIGFRSVAQRDPLVEFKNEAFRMFEQLKQAIQHYIVDQLLKLLRGNISITVQRPEPKRKAPRILRTNADELARTSGQAKSDTGEELKRVPARGTPTMTRRGQGMGQRQNGHGGARELKGSQPSGTPGAPLRQAPLRGPTVATTSAGPVAAGKVGRNDLCPCGSGKKYKKCHGA